jgi:hypothetical protein
MHSEERSERRSVPGEASETKQIDLVWSDLQRSDPVAQSLILAESASGWSSNSTAIITAVYHICILSRVATLLRSVRFSMRACDAQRFFSRTLFSFPHPGPLGFSFACCCLFLVEQAGRGAGNVPR